MLKDETASRVSRPVVIGKSDYDSYYKWIATGISDKVDAAVVQEMTLKSVIQATWHYGYSQEHYEVAITPQGMATVKLLAEGQVRWLLFDSKTLLPCVKNIMGVEQITMKQVQYETVTVTQISTIA